MSFECGIPGCMKKISRKHLMCLAHWTLVPPVIQHAVEKTQTELAQGPHEWHILKQKRHDVMMARAVAIASVADPQALVAP